jgi:ribosome-associated protein
LARDKKIQENQVSGAAPFRAATWANCRLFSGAARVAAENGGTNIVVLDLTGLTALFDYFVIATGTSSRQLRAMSDDIETRVKTELNDRRMNMEGSDDSRWIVLDFGTVVVHLFDEETRQFYGLEALWADCPRLDLSETLKGV